MKYRNLGRTDVKLSLIGLGTMTWGEQNTEAEAHSQIDFALERGINFVDTAEMYPVPPMAETQGATERYIGTWLAKSGRRQDIFLASKVAGPVRDPKRPGHIRDGKTFLDRNNLTQALNDSLKRLQTDYLDLYQLHWPDRSTATFGKLAYPWREDEHTTSILETLSILDEFVRAGKIRHIGVSNETPWGLAQFLHLAQTHKLPRIASIQNPYNLLNRLFESGLSEFTHLEQVSLLAYSPLAMGRLTGKYRNGASPKGARLSEYTRFNRYDSPQALAASDLYTQLALDHGLSPTQLALAWVNEQPFVASNIIGATTLEQLEENIASIDTILSEEVLKEINTIHQTYPNPSP